MADKETVIGPETRISGEVRGEEDLIVRGRIDGKVQLTQTLTVEKGATVQADVDVRHLVVAGTVVGAIVASESVKLTSTARVVGDLASPRVIMEADDTEVIKRLVESGFGYSILPQYALDGREHGFQKLRAPGRVLVRQQALAMPKTEYPRALTIKVAEFLTTALGEKTSHAGAVQAV